MCVTVLGWRDEWTWKLREGVVYRNVAEQTRKKIKRNKISFKLRALSTRVETPERIVEGRDRKIKKDG